MGLSQVSENLNTLSLITDKLVIVQPSEQNLRKWKYDYEKFDKLVNRGVFLPIFPGGEPNPFSAGIRREDLLKDPEFFSYYEKAIENDLESEEFFTIAEELQFTPQELAFNINWDLIVSQVLNSPIVTINTLSQIWQHKFRTSIRDLSKIGAPPPEAQNAHILETFLNRVLDDLPSNLTVDQLVEFRKHKRSENFRSWFREELERTSAAQELPDGTQNDAIFQDFRKLAHKFGRRTRRVSATISTLSSMAGAAIGSMVAQLPGAIAGSSASLAPYAFETVLREVWGKHGANNWVFVLLEFRSDSQI